MDPATEHRDATPPPPASRLAPPPHPPLHHALRHRGALLALAAALVALAGPAVVVVTNPEAPEENMVRYWAVVATSQLGGLAAIALGIATLAARGRPAVLAALAIGVGIVGGFFGAAYAFGG